MQRHTKTPKSQKENAKEKLNIYKKIFKLVI